MLSKSQLKRAGSQRVSVRAQDTVSILRATGNKRISPAEFNALKKYFSVPALQYLGELPARLIDPLYDAIIDIAPKLYTLGAQPYPWDVPAGTEIMIDPACLSGCGAVKTPIRLVNDGEVLAPDGEQILYSAVAPYSSYVAQISGDPTTSAVAINLPGGHPKIPAMLLYLGIGIRVVVTYKHAAGATGPYLRVLLGNTAVSVSTSMLIDGSAVISNEATFDAVARITKLGDNNTGLFLPNGRAWNNTGASITAATALVDKACSTDLDFYVQLACFPNSQTINIQKLQVSIIP